MRNARLAGVSPCMQSHTSGSMPGGPAGLGRRPADVGLQRGIDEAVYWRRNAMAAAKLDHLAGEPWQLEPVAAQQIVAHRGHVVGGHRAYPRERPVGAVRREPDALS